MTGTSRSCFFCFFFFCRALKASQGTTALWLVLHKGVPIALPRTSLALCAACSALGAFMSLRIDAKNCNA